MIQNTFFRFCVVWGAIFALFLLIMAQITSGATIFATEDFNAYNDDEIVGQGDWAGNTNKWWVEGTDVFEGAKALKYKGGGSSGIYRIGTAQTDGQMTIYIKQYHTDQNYAGMQFALSDASYNQIVFGIDYDVANKIYYQTNAKPYFNVIGDTIYDTWFYIQIQWQSAGNFKYNINGGGWSDWIAVQFPAQWANVDRLKLLTSSNSNASNYPVVDYIAENTQAPPTSEVFLTTPESGSTITDDSTELVGGWTNIDSTTWTNIKIAFIDLQIGETSGVVNVPITDDYGTFEIPLSDFAIPNNGGWNLRAVVENAYEYNFDIPNPPYNLIFDIEGYSTPYEFEDFETWYSENVEDYEEPSTWAMNLTGFMNPIFEKIGQFGNRINDYLDVSTGYEKGLQIGSVFPVIGAYVLKIDLFFGGFPMVQFFKWGILIMIGLFAVKIILKLLAFIPFIGGGG